MSTWQCGGDEENEAMKHFVYVLAGVIAVTASIVFATGTPMVTREDQQINPCSKINLTNCYDQDACSKNSHCVSKSGYSWTTSPAGKAAYKAGPVINLLCNRATFLTSSNCSGQAIDDDYWTKTCGDSRPVPIGSRPK
jgi:hypothetical protein